VFHYTYFIDLWLSNTGVAWDVRKNFRRYKLKNKDDSISDSSTLNRPFCEKLAYSLGTKIELVFANFSITMG